jgi:single-strand DNA-binding protein
MANFNKVLLMGNITRDPELSYLPANQTPVVQLGLAVNRTWTGADGQKKEETTFVDCTAFGKQAEVLAKFKKKGDPIFVEGRLKLDQWEGQDGSKRSKLKVIIENFQFLNRAGGPQQFDGGDGEAQAGGGGYAPRQQAAPQARQPYRAGGRPVAQPAARPAPNVDMDPPSGAEDDAPPIKDDDIPF